MSDPAAPAWRDVDRWFEARLAPPDPVFDSALAANAAAGLPPYDVSPLQGRLLELLVRLSRARRVLEIGTLGGYSTIWLARGLAAGGRVVTLERDARHAAVAEENLRRAALLDRVELRVGAALDLLPLLSPPFDLVFIDADKSSNLAYLAEALRLTRPAALIVADNVVRDGKVIDGASEDANVLGVRAFTELVAAEPRLCATALQTVGVKGWDGFIAALVVEPGVPEEGSTRE